MAKDELMHSFTWDEPGYRPLVFSDGWQTAILNWHPTAEVSAVDRVEQHLLTDEVFILWRGRAALVVTDADGLHVVDAAHGEVHNILKGVWHTVIGSRDSSWIIVENQDTHLHDTQYRPMLAEEMAAFHAQLPDWAQL